ncbi:MAG: SPOR domain-containing protein [Xenococcus sp. (in: cyanobacteria)]
MTIKVFFLNRLFRNDTSSFTSLLLIVIFSVLGNSFFIESCLAQSARKNNLSNMIAQNDSLLPSNRLPPPPPLSAPNRIIKTKESLAAPNNIQPPHSRVANSEQEYIFNAPNNLKTSYKVEVFGGSNSILQQVRKVEPKAFIKGNVIQVGIFSQEDNALDLVRQLTLKGLWARIIVD